MVRFSQGSQDTRAKRSRDVHQPSVPVTIWYQRGFRQPFFSINIHRFCQPLGNTNTLSITAFWNSKNWRFTRLWYMSKSLKLYVVHQLRNPAIISIIKLVWWKFACLQYSLFIFIVKYAHRFSACRLRWLSLSSWNFKIFISCPILTSIFMKHLYSNFTWKLRQNRHFS